MTITERVIAFGGAGSLHGVLAEPDRDTRVENAPAVLCWNVGLHHHVGPFRYYVDLCRRLAENGHLSLRFDVSGLGDSDVSRNDSRSDSERALSDVRDAMVALRNQTKFDRFVLVGFCSGVDAAHAVAVSDRSVVGLVYVEGYDYRTRGYYLRYPKRYLDPNRWERNLRRRFPKLFHERVAPPNPGAEREQVFLRDYPKLADLRNDILAMTNRGSKLLVIHAARDSYTYREQFFDMLGLPTDTANIDVTYYPNADHTFFLEADRVQCVSRIADWMSMRFGHRAAHEHKAAGEVTNANTSLSPVDSTLRISSARKRNASHGSSDERIQYRT